MQVEVPAAQVIWPQELKNQNEAIHETPIGTSSLILFRKACEGQSIQSKIVNYVIPPLLSDEKLGRLCKTKGEHQLFEEEGESYYSTYLGQGEVAIYFKNKFTGKSINLNLDFTMENLAIRGEDPTVRTLEFTLEPFLGNLVIVDAVQRDQPFEFEYQLSFSIDSKQEEEGEEALPQ